MTDENVNGTELTEGELRELADAGDQEAIEALAELGRQEDEDRGEPPVFDQDETLTSPVESEAAALASQEPIAADPDVIDTQQQGIPPIERPPEGDEHEDGEDPVVDAHISPDLKVGDVTHSVYIGDTIRVGTDRYKVRMTHGNGTVSTTDGRRFKAGEYAVVG